MPQMPVGPVRIYYEEAGAGPPLLMVAGLGYWRWCWFKNVGPLSRAFRVITPDNRGVGDSSKPDEPYTIAEMAGDLVGLLDGLGIETAHVLGHSMGAAIALELALAHPERVGGLVLTGVGSPAARDPAVAELLRPDPALSHEQNMRRAFPAVVAPGYWEQHPEEMEECIRVRMSKPTPLWSYARQVQAISAWARPTERVGALEPPTLIIQGDSDRLTPPTGAQELAAQIPGAQLVLLPGAGHLPFIEMAPMFNRVVMEFLQSV